MRLPSALAAAAALALAAVGLRAAGGGAHAASPAWALMTFAVAAFGGRLR